MSAALQDLPSCIFYPATAHGKGSFIPLSLQLSEAEVPSRAVPGTMPLQQRP